MLCGFYYIHIFVCGHHFGRWISQSLNCEWEKCQYIFVIIEMIGDIIFHYLLEHHSPTIILQLYLSLIKMIVPLVQMLHFNKLLHSHSCWFKRRCSFLCLHYSHQSPHPTPYSQHWKLTSYYSCKDSTSVPVDSRGI